MKTLLLMRHAKSDWGDEGLPDHERPLNKRGRRDAPSMGALLRELGLVPDCILSSTATRARQTAEAVAMESGYAGRIAWHDDLYGADPETIIACARGAPEAAARLLIVGHNPGMEDLAGHFAGRIEPFPTCALARYDFGIAAWQDLARGAAVRARGLWRPKELD